MKIKPLNGQKELEDYHREIVKNLIKENLDEKNSKESLIPLQYLTTGW